MARDEKALRDFAERSASLLAGAGFPRMPARVLMALMISERAGLTAAELSDQLEVSAAAVSGAVRYLVTLAMVRRVPQSGSRRDLYELPEDAWYTASLSKNPLYGQVIALIAAVLPDAGEPGEPAADRVSEMKDFFVFVQKRLPEVLEEWEQQRGG